MKGKETMTLGKNLNLELKLGLFGLVVDVGLEAPLDEGVLLRDASELLFRVHQKGRDLLLLWVEVRAADGVRWAAVGHILAPDNGAQQRRNKCQQFETHFLKFKCGSKHICLHTENFKRERENINLNI